jgi:SAM-dependent methyltransferase
MDIGTSDWLKKVRPKMPEFLGNVLEVGSLNINGSAREFFPKSQCGSYLGIDMIYGKDVDIQMNAHDIKDKFKEDSSDVVICLNTLEHDNKFWLTLDGINYVLKKGGYFVFCQPTYNFPIHKHPKDYWRVLEDGVREVIMEGFEIIDIEEVYSKKVVDPTHRKGWRGINPIFCALGRKL